MKHLILCVLCSALIACGQSDNGQTAPAGDGSEAVDRATSEAKTLADRAQAGKAPVQEAEGTDQCAVFDTGLVAELFSVDDSTVNYRRSIPAARAGHVVCSANWKRDGPPWQNEVSVTLLSDDFGSPEEAVTALEQAVRTLSEGLTIRVGGKERIRKTEFEEWMDGVGDKAIFTSKGTLMAAGNSRRITVGVSAMGDEAQDREKAMELARRIFEQL